LKTVKLSAAGSPSSRRSC